MLLFRHIHACYRTTINTNTCLVPYQPMFILPRTTTSIINFLLHSRLLLQLAHACYTNIINNNCRTFTFIFDNTCVNLLSLSVMSFII